ncbi:MAG: glycosyltransferase [Bacteroidia bacterium]|nr:glycosyltransferase [Bacteroidia bacterium]NNC84446.1 glycosyltransferase [Bacteroidia bacterium]
MTNKNTHTPLVSIITVVYNGAPLLEKTILSIVEQTHENVEYLIIDGASNDGTQEIIKKYEDKISYWISEPDNGIYDAMNKGLKKATGDYVWFMNAGDLINEKEVLNKLMIQDQNGSDIYFGETYLINQSGDVLGTRSDLTTRKLPDELNWKSMSRGMVVSHQSIIVKREIAPLYNLKYNCSADIDWVIKCLKAATSIKNTQMVLSKYLIDGYSIQQQKLCWWERFKLYVVHYGLLNTIYNHIIIIGRHLKFSLKSS